MDPLVTKERLKRAKKGENNGKTSLVTPFSEIKPSRNIEEAKAETKEFEEWKIDAFKCHGAKKAKTGGDNVSTCMVSPGSEVNPSQNNSIGKTNKLSISHVSSIPHKLTKEPEEENNRRKRERRSQLDMSDLTPTKEEAKKAKMVKIMET
ncbi:hypothetical protein AMTR_s00086p00019660 [Amborella trichopoda]|uniref:Uncharacterized protein n=1 Tax=Amborella trichopoda TaxID=13333 RepID=W1P4B0_AMBTC|nr:hypothetical protein AMTR_s00086p00019660 [Amborella trichopoda]